MEKMIFCENENRETEHFLTKHAITKEEGHRCDECGLFKQITNGTKEELHHETL